MKRILAIRVALLVVGVLIWGYGYRADLSNVRLAAIGIIAVALLLRFVPDRWSGGDAPR